MKTKARSNKRSAPVVLVVFLGLGAGTGVKLASSTSATRVHSEPKPLGTAPADPLVAQNDTASHKPTISREQAITLAVNDLSAGEGGSLYLENPRHTATYSSADGVTFAPKFSALNWNWRLSHFGSAGRNWLSGERPQPRSAGIDVAFDYGAFTERYLAKAESVEQQFVLHRKPGALDAGEDLVIRGDIDCAGAFDATHGEQLGWVWRGETRRDTVGLGQVTVFDADGELLPASMTATADGTEITVDGPALLAASFPVTVDPEIGTDDFLIGGALADPGAHRPSTISSAFHRSTQTHLVVWTSSEPDGTTALFGQGFRGYINARLGEPKQFAHRVAGTPKVAADDTGFLVTWVSRVTGSCVGRLVASDGVPSSDEFDISPGRADGNLSPAVAGDPDGGFLVAWADEDRRAHMRTVSGDSITLDLSTPVAGEEDVHALQVVHNPARGEYCLVWRKDIVGVGGGRTYPIYARQVSEAGVFVHPAATLIAPDSRNMFPGRELTVCFNPDDREYLFAWNLSAGSPSFNVDLHGRLFTEDLTPRAAAFPVANFPDSSDFPVARWHRCAYVGAFRKYIVAWLDVEDPVGGIRARFVDPATGGPSGAEKRITGDDATQFAMNGLPIGIAVRPLIFSLPRISGGGGATSAATIVATPVDEILGELTVAVNSVFPVGIDGEFELASAAPAIAHSAGAESYTVVWQQELDAVGDWHIVGRQVADDGHTTVSPLVVFSDNGQLLNNIAPAVAAKPGEALVAWQGDQIVPGVLGGLKTEVYGAYWDLAANSVGAPFQISSSGTQSRTALKAETPAVAAGNGDDFVVVWGANAEAGALLPSTPQIYRRVAHANSGTMGSIARVSDHTSPGAPAAHPAITFGSAAEGYQVVWQGSPAGSEELEIFGRRLRGTSGDPLGSVQRITTVGPDGHLGFEARTPDVAFSSAVGFLAVWAGEADATNDTEIYARYLSSTAPQDGRFQVSDMGESGPFAFLWKPDSPAVSYDATLEAFVVTWSSDHVAPGLNGNEREIYARSFFLQGGSGEQERISALGEDGDGNIHAERPAIAAGPDGRFLVVFDGNDTGGAFNEERTGVFGQGYEAAMPSDTTVVILSLELVGDDVVIRWRSGDIGTVIFQTSTDLQTWEIAGEVEGSIGQTETFTDIGGATGSARFYRAIGIGAAP